MADNKQCSTIEIETMIPKKSVPQISELSFFVQNIFLSFIFSSKFKSVGSHLFYYCYEHQNNVLVQYLRNVSNIQVYDMTRLRYNMIVGK